MAGLGHRAESAKWHPLYDEEENDEEIEEVEENH